MAAATTIIAAGSLALGAAQAASASKRAKDFQKAIENAPETEPTNFAEGVQISTRGSELALESARSTNATLVDVLQRAGTRGVLGGIPKISQADIALSEKFGALIDQQEAELSRIQAEGEREKQRIIQANEQANLLGLGQGLQAARQDVQSGIQNIVSSGLALTSAINNKSTNGSGGGGSDDPKSPEQQMASADTNRLPDSGIDLTKSSNFLGYQGVASKTNPFGFPDYPLGLPNSDFFNNPLTNNTQANNDPYNFNDFLIFNR